MKFSKRNLRMPVTLGVSSLLLFVSAAIRANTIVEQLPKTGFALVNYWSVSCPPCRREIPMLNELAKQGVIVIAVDYDEPSIDEVSTRATSVGIAYPSLMLEQAKLPLPSVLPTSYLLCNGKVLASLVGEQPQSVFLQIREQTQKQHGALACPAP